MQRRTPTFGSASASYGRRLSRQVAAPWPPTTSGTTLGTFSDYRAFIYGTNDNALVYTYDSVTQILSIEFAVVEGSIVGHH
ncbi:MAG TPA: hypothetical protein VFU02_05455 [Polyangiaceae bacterium]|nr:hypothetical protein [Polyangiaceae bacterium]